MTISGDPLLRLEESLLHGSNVIILGDLICNRIGGDPEGNAQSDFCSTFGLSQLVTTATRVTEKSKSLIDVALTTNENTIDACDVIQSAISDHSLVSLTLKLKTPRPRISFVTTRSYKNYDHDSFIEDLANVPFHIVNLFEILTTKYMLLTAFSNMFWKIMLPSNKLRFIQDLIHLCQRRSKD